jgi:membrane associated rhomboid family serine protease
VASHSYKDIKLILKATIFPLVFVATMWLVYLLDVVYNLNLYKWGVYTRTTSGLFGIVFSPFIHNSSSINHILSNSVPMLVLGSALFYFYKEIALKVFVTIWMVSGLWLWILSRPSFHIGASSIVYGLAFFSVFSGWIRKSKPLMGLSLLVVFLYGSMVWGLFPIDWSISFEGHAYGAFCGLVLSYIYRKQGPQREVFIWEDDSELEEDDFDIDATENENIQ